MFKITTPSISTLCLIFLFGLSFQVNALGGIHETLYIGGDIVYPECTKGTYIITGQLYSGKPIYKRQGGNCRGRSGWYLYMNNDRWAISFDDPMTNPSHGVTDGLASEWPWDSVWPGGALVTPVNQVNIGGDIVYKSCTNGTFTFIHSVINGKPIYKREGGACRGRDGWFLYYNNGRWVISFDDPLVSPSHGVTDGLAADWPWDNIWPGGAIISIK